MEAKTATAGGEPSRTLETTHSRRRKRSGDADNLRYFLPKVGSSLTKPELGEEMACEGQALIEAFKNGQHFYTLTAWKAVPEVNGNSGPVIVKHAVART